MKALVDGLAGMSGLRDRDELDLGLVRLVSTTGDAGIRSITLVRVVGDGDDLRCLNRGRLTRGSDVPVRDEVWVDWTTLPKLDDFPNRQTAVSKAKNLVIPGTPCVTVFPIGSVQGFCALLEVESDAPLSEEAMGLVDSILQSYQNVLGLLDYGEKDALTELLNRKTFDGAFFKATSEPHEPEASDPPDRRASKPSGGYWLAVLDIDHFKRVNDNFGHLIGDEVLLLMARLMRSSFRFHDQLYRFGGEEFVILMRCVDPADAKAALERLRTKVEAFAFPQVGSITVSIGFSALLVNDTPSGAFGRADKAVYYAKTHGRNQVCSYQDLVASGELVEQAAEAMDVDLF